MNQINPQKAWDAAELRLPDVERIAQYGPNWVDKADENLVKTIFHLVVGEIHRQRIEKVVTNKPTRKVLWANLREWEPFLTCGTTVVWRGANGILYRSTIVRGLNGNYRVRMRDLSYCEIYIEDIERVETTQEEIELVKDW